MGDKSNKIFNLQKGTKYVAHVKWIHPQDPLFLEHLIGWVLQGAEVGRCCCTSVHKISSPQSGGKGRKTPCRAVQCLRRDSFLHLPLQSQVRDSPRESLVEFGKVCEMGRLRFPFVTVFLLSHLTCWPFPGIPEQGKRALEKTDEGPGPHPVLPRSQTYGREIPQNSKGLSTEKKHNLKVENYVLFGALLRI